ncbi:hypothetical protein ma117 [Moumouvirus australiensis]|uniref:Uncharacterized protein n=1 Tax=Moumouvirus australiensis TaxID=2109587 RepID=A0A2P1EKT4_9VIRU|nr:hypothetical protein QKC55_gp787 [Moumouvirus australiensis]AVL94503.1 hypothetical protein ma117 [Moumouvirus australiensis]
MHQIIFCEPNTFYYDKLDKKDLVKLKPSISINDNMYDLIINDKYNSFVDHNGNGNAYVFGKLFSMKSYKFVHGHGNDVAQTGFLDLDLLRKGVWFKKNEKGEYTEWDDYDPSYEWDEKKSHRAIRKANKSILWFGETIGGDIGANLYVHKTEGIIDSIIVDIGFFFGVSDSESSESESSESELEQESSESESEQESEFSDSDDSE